MAEDAVSVDRLTKDLVAAANTLSDHEARFLVDAYYMMQENRKRTSNQLNALADSHEPNAVLLWLNKQNETLENQIKRALDKYTANHVVGEWMRSIYGIGPVISAGLLAHIDITKAPVVGHIWSFAGLIPGQIWEKGQRRPWNATLKVLCWKAGQSFMKFHGNEKCYYGHLYKERKEQEILRNERGDNTTKAAEILKRVSETTVAYGYLKEGKLPPGQIDARARRYAVKLFLSHLHDVWYRKHYGVAPPAPYPIAYLQHVHYIAPPAADVPAAI